MGISDTHVYVYIILSKISSLIEYGIVIFLFLFFFYVYIYLYVYNFVPLKKEKAKSAN